MSDPAAASAGLFGSLRRLAHTGLDLAGNRIALFGTELEQEKLRLASGMLLAAVGFLLLAVALLLLNALVVLLFWETHVLAVTGALAAIQGVAGAWVLRRAQEKLRAAEGGPFALSLGELRRDRDGLFPVDP